MIELTSVDTNQDDFRGRERKGRGGRRSLLAHRKSLGEQKRRARSLKKMAQHLIIIPTVFSILIGHTCVVFLECASKIEAEVEK